MRGRREVAGSQPKSTAVHYTEARINFWDLTPYLTYGLSTNTHFTTYWTKKAVSYLYYIYFLEHDQGRNWNMQRLFQEKDSRDQTNRSDLYRRFMSDLFKARKENPKVILNVGGLKHEVFKNVVLAPPPLFLFSFLPAFIISIVLPSNIFFNSLPIVSSYSSICFSLFFLCYFPIPSFTYFLFVFSKFF